MFMLSFICDSVLVILSVSLSCANFLLFISVLSFRIQVSKWEGCDAINWFIPVMFLCLSQSRTWISNAKCCGLFRLFNGLTGELVVRFVDIGGIVDHNY